MKPPSRKRVTEWVLDTWSQLSKENITKSFTCCGLNLAKNGMGMTYSLFKKGKARRQKLKFQLSILVDKSDAANSFISSSDEEDISEK